MLSQVGSAEVRRHQSFLTLVQILWAGYCWVPGLTGPILNRVHTGRRPLSNISSAGFAWTWLADRRGSPARATS